jgi:cytochrome c oxidase subunit 2
MKRRLLLLAAALVALSSCSADDHPLNTLDPAGEHSEDIDNFIKPVFIVAFVVLAIIFGAVILMWAKFRVPKAEPGTEVAGPYADEEFPEQIHGKFGLEILWTIIPTVIMAFIGIFGTVVLLKIDDVEAAEGDRPLEIVVVGHQWWWEYQYHLDGDAADGPPDFVTAGEAVIPTGQDVRVYITSRDVIHSFWIPRLHGKRDAVPGRVHPWVLQANEPGRYSGTCTEFCGLSHAYMRMYVTALDPAGYDTWVQGQLEPQTPPAEDDPLFAGWEVFNQNCARCHMVVGSTARDLDGDPETDPQPDDWSIYGVLDDYRGAGLSQGRYVTAENLTSGAAPNLTHFASRTSYAGAFEELYHNGTELLEDDPAAYLDMIGAGARVDRETLEQWIRDPASIKPNRAENFQGMPDVGLSEDQIDLVVDYLLSLD